MPGKKTDERYELLKPYFPSNGISIERFAEIEALLYLLSQHEPDADPRKAYLLLAQYHVIGTNQCTPMEYQLQCARATLGYYRSEKYWQDALQKYCDPDYDAVRAFVIDRTAGTWTFKRNNADYPYAYEKRLPEWTMLCSHTGLKRNSRPAAGKGKYFYFMEENGSQKQISVTFRQMPPHKPLPNIPPKNIRFPIRIPIAELLDCARQMKNIMPDDYCFDVLSHNKLLSAKNAEITEADSLDIQHIANIVGMVGSGKSTLIKVLAFWANFHRKRIVIVLDTVAEVFHLWEYLDNMGVSDCPLIGRRERIKYINQLVGENQTCLPPRLSAYLTPACLLDGMDDNREGSMTLGDEPCYSLKKDHGDRRHYLCPYFDFCPGSRMLRECYEKNVIITTAQGFAAARVGKNRETFIEAVLDTAALVIFDECDRVQKTLDQLFLPETSFDDYIKECAPDCSQFMRMGSRKREADPAAQRYDEFQRQSVTVMSCVLDSLRQNSAWGRIQYGDSFSALSLLDTLYNDKKYKIPEQIYQDLYSLIHSDDTDSHENLIWDVCQASCASKNPDLFDRLYDRWAKSQNNFVSLKNPKDTRILHTRIKLILRLIYFDQFIRDSGDAYAASHDTAYGQNELFSFLQTRFQEQQHILPSALCGNLFGMKRTAEDDIILFRQFAFGRSLMKDLPWLRTDENGNAAGAHALLLSGSSWAQGSYEYHVNRPVNYILDAGKDKRDFLERTVFRESGFHERVSGSFGEQKDRMLSAVTKKSADLIIQEYSRKEGKILVVVNSYTQSVMVQDVLQAELNRRKCAAKVCAMIKDSSDNPDKNSPDSVHSSGSSDGQNQKLTIRRGEVYKFADMDADILIAPAAAIERGHNIVDEKGHSALDTVFFMIRPLPVPDDLQEHGSKLNGYIEANCPRGSDETTFAYHQRVRAEAVRQWAIMNQNGKYGLADLDEASQRDIVATLFILILQIFGRLARVTDTSKPAPHIYFMDGAFRRRMDRPDDFDCLNALHKYLERLMSDSASGEIAKALYEPFYKAYKEGIPYVE